MINLSKVSDLAKNTAASDIEIQEVESLLKLELPNVYKDLVRFTNGISIGGGLVIYGTEDIVERIETWEVDEYASGFIAIGDDGGGNVFLMLQDADEKEVLVIDSGEMNPRHANLVTSDFDKWVKSGCLNEIEQKTNIEIPNTCNYFVSKTS